MSIVVSSNMIFSEFYSLRYKWIHKLCSFPSRYHKICISISIFFSICSKNTTKTSVSSFSSLLNTLIERESNFFKGIVKRFFLFQGYSDMRESPLLKRREIFIFDTHRRLSAIIAPSKFTQRHSS